MRINKEYETDSERNYRDPDGVELRISRYVKDDPTVLRVRQPGQGWSYFTLSDEDLKSLRKFLKVV